ncbi:hypothetical protein [Arthrobacter sp. MMS18-M83]|uniref:hypothetical protein n=1 Tax=Arthrobacter sp. MMS18-M83 TaxID=2996261 RepID=UPI00227CD902|nr:hypothetical protein [Arthrobacter sp. MMS18-M83]WAH98144.1 hypothetical protein OW521_04480 [Arthrobacter sp. MMS18-M83]
MNTEINAPEELARYRFGYVVRHAQHPVLELTWLQTSSAMSDEDWMTGLMMLAAEAAAADVTAILIDATSFRHGFEDREAAMSWRDARVIPRYNNAGVQKFAFVMPEGYPGPTAESGAAPVFDGPAAQFPTQWFRTRESAMKWLVG